MISFVLKMDSYSDREEHESSAKRLKLDRRDSYGSVLCNEIGFSNFSAPIDAQIDINEGISADCDSGYEASTMESLPTPSRQTFLTDGEVQENFSDSLLQLHATDNLDATQDSIEGDDNVSVTSHLSELSGLSDLSGQDWKPMAQSFVWLQKQKQNRVDPRTILIELGVELTNIPQYVDDVTLWKLIINMLAEPPRRHKLRHVNTLDDVVRLLKGANNVIVLTGAGVSVSCGIPDFRSRDGIYSRLAIDFPDLPDPQAMFDISYFTQDPRPFFKFAKDIYPGKFQPSPCHRFIKLLEKNKKLLRNYTQNIDTLENVAGIKNVIECHGSFATATCTKCMRKVTADVIRDVVISQNIPLCEVCQPEVGPSISMDDLKDREPGELRDLVSNGIMKPDIVFFGEGLPDSFHEAMSDDKNKADLILVIGSSLKVRPVALIPSSLPAHVPQILINREPLPHCHFDVELLGDCDVIINHLCQLMGDKWKEGVYNEEKLRETLHLLPWRREENTRVEEKSVEDTNTSDCVEEEISTDYSINEKCPEDVANPSSSLQISYNHYINNNMSINGNTTKLMVNSDNVKSIKERHISTDSARDSGIGENSNFTDIDTSKFDEDSSNNRNVEQLSSVIVNESSETTNYDNTDSDMKGYWQPKQKRSITERLPKKCFYLIQPSRYIFPGAELYIDPDEKINYFDNSSSESSESDSETETENVDSSF